MPASIEINGATRRLHRAELDQSVASPGARGIQFFLFLDGGGVDVGGGGVRKGRRRDLRGK